MSNLENWKAMHNDSKQTTCRVCLHHVTELLSIFAKFNAHLYKSWPLPPPEHQLPFLSVHYLDISDSSAHMQTTQIPTDESSQEAGERCMGRMRDEFLSKYALSTLCYFSTRTDATGVVSSRELYERRRGRRKRHALGRCLNISVSTSVFFFSTRPIELGPCRFYVHGSRELCECRRERQMRYAVHGRHKRGSSLME